MPMLLRTATHKHRLPQPSSTDRPHDDTSPDGRLSGSPSVDELSYPRCSPTQPRQTTPKTTTLRISLRAGPDHRMPAISPGLRLLSGEPDAATPDSSDDPGPIATPSKRLRAPPRRRPAARGSHRPLAGETTCDDDARQVPTRKRDDTRLDPLAPPDGSGQRPISPRIAADRRRYSTPGGRPDHARRRHPTGPDHTT